MNLTVWEFWFNIPTQFALEAPGMLFLWCVSRRFRYSFKAHKIAIPINDEDGE